MCCPSESFLSCATPSTGSPEPKNSHQKTSLSQAWEGFQTECRKNEKSVYLGIPDNGSQGAGCFSALNHKCRPGHKLPETCKIRDQGHRLRHFQGVGMSCKCNSTEKVEPWKLLHACGIDFSHDLFFSLEEKICVLPSKFQFQHSVEFWPGNKIFFTALYYLSQNSTK